MPVLLLEVQFQAKLKLSWVIGRGRMAVITPVARALTERVDSREERRIAAASLKRLKRLKPSAIKSSRSVLAKPNGTHHAQIQRCVTVRDAAIASPGCQW